MVSLQSETLVIIDQIFIKQTGVKSHIYLTNTIQKLTMKNFEQEDEKTGNTRIRFVNNSYSDILVTNC